MQIVRLFPELIRKTQESIDSRPIKILGVSPFFVDKITAEIKAEINAMPYFFGEVEEDSPLLVNELGPYTCAIKESIDMISAQKKHVVIKNLSPDIILFLKRVINMNPHSILASVLISVDSVEENWVPLRARPQQEEESKPAEVYEPRPKRKRSRSTDSSGLSTYLDTMTDEEEELTLPAVQPRSQGLLSPAPQRMTTFVSLAALIYSEEKSQSKSPTLSPISPCSELQDEPMETDAESLQTLNFNIRQLSTASTATQASPTSPSSLLTSPATMEVTPVFDQTNFENTLGLLDNTIQEGMEKIRDIQKSIRIEMFKECNSHFVTRRLLEKNSFKVECKLDAKIGKMGKAEKEVIEDMYLHKPLFLGKKHPYKFARSEDFIRKFFPDARQLENALIDNVKRLKEQRAELTQRFTLFQQAQAAAPEPARPVLLRPIPCRRNQTQ